MLPIKGFEPTTWRSFCYRTKTVSTANLKVYFSSESNIDKKVLKKWPSNTFSQKKDIHSQFSSGSNKICSPV